ncbi:MAG TPA: hypothetical protein VM221_12265 [Armatimonadota bacterium]|nr:hypothetical protein [Armatimonadota bacterium]
MSAEREFIEAAERIWQEAVASRYMYRGMCLEDLSDPLDPQADPFRPIRPELCHLLEILQAQVSRGFRFTVHEDYSSFSFDLKDILDWSKRDLDSPGIGFASIHHSALGYAHNYRGSQLKQNLKYITDHLPERKDDPILRAGMTAAGWALVERVSEWVSSGDLVCTKVVIWVRRTSPAFEVNEGALPLGSLDYFMGRVVAAVEREGLSRTPQAIQHVLPPEQREFNVRAQRPISRSEIEKIEEVRSTSWRPIDP